MSGSLSAYRDEIFNFLRTVTIKFEPFAYLMGKTYMQTYGLTDPHQEWNPYYINLAGMYTSNDTQMEVYCEEVSGTVLFDSTLSERYPETAALYKVPRKEYFTLEERYPTNRGLIKTMTYSAGDMEAVLSAENFALLGYDESLLELNERASMVHTLKKFLKMCKERWWIDEFRYEDMYAVTFWGMMWQLMPAVLLMQRFLNIKTPYVHSFHIWEYLTSKGLGDYRDVLTNNQTNWLYRNIDWILVNKGKNYTLHELADNLLQEIYISLLAKDLVQTTEDFLEADYIANPEYINWKLTTEEEDSREDHTTLSYKLYTSELDVYKTADVILEEEDELCNTPHNKLPTKFLEFKKDMVNTMNEHLMVNFFLDTLMYRHSIGDISYTVEFTDPLLTETYSLSIDDAILLWYYACHRGVDETPTLIPTQYRCHIPFLRAQPSDSEVRQSVFFDSTEHYLINLIDYDNMINNNIAWYPNKFASAEKFVDIASQQFLALLYFLQQMEQSNKFIYHRAMQSFFEDTRYSGWVTLDLTDSTTYTEWFNSKSEWYTTLKNNYDNETKYMTWWNNLGLALFDAIFPIDYEKYPMFAGVIRKLEEIYASIRDLFIQLGSYNITYLENSRDTYQYFRIKEPEFYTGATTYYMDNFWMLVIENLLFKGKNINYIKFPCLKIDFISSMAGMSYSYKHNLVISLDWERDSTMYRYGVIQTSPDIKHEASTITRAQSIFIETH